MYRFLKKKYRKALVFLAPHPLFSSIDRLKLSKIVKGTAQKGHITLRPKGFKQRIKIRKNYTDREVVHYVLQDTYHLPPKGVTLPKSPVILDLGTNIGLTVAHYKQLFPLAKVYGFEMNKENFELAKFNTKSYDDVLITNKAVWINTDGISYSAEASHDSYAIAKESAEMEQESAFKVPSTTINEIIKTNNLEQVDYVKMDIEGAEEDILDHEDLSWLKKVSVLNIEMHFEEGNDRIEHYIAILEKQGFKAWKSDAHWSSIFAVKSELPK